MAFSYYRSITVDHTKVAANQNDFPMLVSYTNNDLRTVGNGGHVQNANGYDITYYSDSGASSALYWEMEFYNAATGNVISWVKMPTLSSSVDDVIYTFYGDSSISTFQSTASSVWDSNYLGVWHLPDGSTASYEDSTTNNRDFTAYNTPTATTGKIDGGVNFASASSEYMIATGAAWTTITFSGWVKFSSFPGSGTGSMILGLTNATHPGSLEFSHQVGVSPAGKAILYWYNGVSQTVTGATTLSTGTWYYLCGTLRTGTTDSQIYVNGSPDGTAAAGGTVYSGWTTGPKLASAVNTTNPTVPFQYLNGDVDELRASNSLRSANWIATEYANQNSPSTFFTLGSEQTLGGQPTAKRISTVPFLGGSMRQGVF